MESAKDLVARALPDIEQVGGTLNPSISAERFSAALMHPWTTFFDDVSRALQSMNLNVQISKSDDIERYIVANELGLTGRFVKNVCDPVTKALSVTELSNLGFGDVHSIEYVTAHIPDVIVLRRSNVQNLTREDLSITAVGEIKTYWTLGLQHFPITLPIARRLTLEPHIGQVVSYMRSYGLKYGFLSTYNATVFIRRMEDYRLEISLPVLKGAQNPSLRECMVAFCSLAAEDAHYSEGPDFSQLLLRGSAISGLQASTRPSILRPLPGQPPTLPSALGTVGPGTIFFGEGDTAASVRCTRLISGASASPKAVMEVEFNGQKCFAKCWTSELYESFAQEAYVYDYLSEKEPNGYPFFALLIAHGNITCSSIFPAGHILVLSWVDGAMLSTIWPQLHRTEKHIIQRYCREAVAVLRQIGIYVLDCGRHNILYNPRTHKTVMVDFEMIGACSAEHRRDLAAPELFAIFADEPSGMTGG
ncbi:hypothetical protein BJX76DRAFT_340249 [Aspergillus varians]